MKQVSLFLLFLGLLVPAAAAQLEIPADSTVSDSMMTHAYQVFTAEGQPTTLEAVMAAMEEADVVFVGEQHNDPVGHYLEALLLKQAYESYGHGTAMDRPVAVSLEMFQRDVQPIVDEYLAGLITESLFQKSSRPWKNYETDYKPLVEFAREHQLPVLAANAPRRYANRVSRLGPNSLDSLSAWARAWLPPTPFPGPSQEYKEKWDRFIAEMIEEMEKSAKEAAAADSAKEDLGDIKEDEPMHTPKKEEKAEHPMPKGPNYMLDGQAFWDANMAYSIHQHLEETPGALVLHMVGSFHVEEGLGTPAQLHGYHPGVRQLIVVVFAEEDYNTFDAERHKNQGDFIILTDESLPRTYDSDG